MASPLTSSVKGAKSSAKTSAKTAKIGNIFWVCAAVCLLAADSAHMNVKNDSIANTAAGIANTAANSIVNNIANIAGSPRCADGFGVKSHMQKSVNTKYTYHIIMDDDDKNGDQLSK
jgi:hypothetical protein